MPDFYVDSLDISPSEFVYACSELEIDELIAVLYEDGYITSESILKNNNDLSVHDEMFMEYLTKISKSRHLLTKAEEEIIKSIADRL